MTSEEKQSAKRAKKLDKLDAKLAKKQVAAERAALEQSADASRPTDRSTAGLDETSLTAAERSARAAERQVRLQSLRVLLALLGILVATATLLWTIRPWERSTHAPPSATPQPAANSHNS